MARLSDGDRAAFDAVYVTAAPLVRSFVARSLPPADADDVSQVALLKVFERASDYDPTRPALPWILGVAGWEVRTHRRRAGRRREAALDDSSLGRSADDPEQLAEQRELIAHAEALMSELSEADRAAIRASLGIEARPDTSAATFRKRLSRALARLRSAFEEAHDG